jgi:hypothetical protein
MKNISDTAMIYTDRPWSRFIYRLVDWFADHGAVGIWGILTAEEVANLGAVPAGTYADTAKFLQFPDNIPSWNIIPLRDSILVDVCTSHARLVVESDNEYHLTAKVYHWR